MAKVLEEKEKVIQHLQKSNKQLEEYAENRSKVVGVTSNQGKLVSEAKNNKTRSLKTFLPRANMALWFASSFGLELETLEVEENKTGQVHTVNLQRENSIREPASIINESDRASTFSTLPEEEKNRIEHTCPIPTTCIRLTNQLYRRYVSIHRTVVTYGRTVVIYGWTIFYSWYNVVPCRKCVMQH